MLQVVVIFTFSIIFGLDHLDFGLLDQVERVLDITSLKLGVVDTVTFGIVSSLLQLLVLDIGYQLLDLFLLNLPVWCQLKCFKLRLSPALFSQVILEVGLRITLQIHVFH